MTLDTLFLENPLSSWLKGRPQLIHYRKSFIALWPVPVGQFLLGYALR